MKRRPREDDAEGEGGVCARSLERRANPRADRALSHALDVQRSRVRFLARFLG